VSRLSQSSQSSQSQDDEISYNAKPRKIGISEREAEREEIKETWNSSGHVFGESKNMFVGKRIRRFLFTGKTLQVAIDRFCTKLLIKIKRLNDLAYTFIILVFLVRS